MYLKTNDIVKQYSNHLALNKVSIDVPKGSVFGLLGPNGAGKTTLIRIITRITAPDSGEVLIDGRASTSSDVLNIGYLPEERGLYRKMKVGEHAMYLAQLRGLSKKEAHREIMIWFKRFDIMSWYNRRVEELSKGMQQKVQFISTVIHNPDLLIFDEPFSGFDPINTNIIKQEILELREKGATIIFSTHNMSSVEEICDHIALINKSKKILDGNIFDVKNQYRTETFDITYKGEFNKINQLLGRDFEILNHKETNRFNEMTIKHINGSSNNDLLMKLAPGAEIISFNERIPSMNEIFIRVVEENNQ